MVLGFILSGDAWGVFGGMCVRDLRIDVNMSQQSSLWAGLLGSCRFKGDVVLGEQIAKALLEDDPLNHSHHWWTDDGDGGDLVVTMEMD
ncbi:Pentatricopeptide repeat-containing protein [Artemisia annua]|uniref:Pentatricopeptide repeat-containing protein n=1 Tax=Artemisia annua TaxID=35608 RepID=A0A2U1KFG7_ARTAN|nr:Pentatricopeptide repeat-containing protein [Artemisia annua]